MLRSNLEVTGDAAEFGARRVCGFGRVRGASLEVAGFRLNLQIKSVSAELFACLRPNLAVESVAVEYGGNGGIGGIWSLQGFGGSA